MFNYGHLAAKNDFTSSLLVSSCIIFFIMGGALYYHNHTEQEWLDATRKAKSQCRASGGDKMQQRYDPTFQGRIFDCVRVGIKNKVIETHLIWKESDIFSHERRFK